MGGPSRAQQLADAFHRDNYHYVPLVTEDLSVFCGLEVLFLRPDIPGSVIHSGDIDNRLKTLFDALRMTIGAQELPSPYELPAEDEKPFYVLLQDDSLISKISVETDMLLN